MMLVADPGLGCGHDSTAATLHYPRSRIRHAAAFLCSVLIVQLLIQSCPLEELCLETFDCRMRAIGCLSLRAGSNVSRNPIFARIPNTSMRQYSLQYIKYYNLRSTRLRKHLKYVLSNSEVDRKAKEKFRSMRQKLA